MLQLEFLTQLCSFAAKQLAGRLALCRDDGQFTIARLIVTSRVNQHYTGIRRRSQTAVLFTIIVHAPTRFLLRSTREVQTWGVVSATLCSTLQV